MQKEKKKYLFIVQGEGRGHMTQAISLQQTITNAGGEVCCVMVGKSGRRVIPDFFYSKINAPVYTFDSPNFVMDNKNKGIKLISTLKVNIRLTPFFLKNLKFIDQKVKEYKPDIIINFYDLLGGIYNAIYTPRAKFFCIGHQYLLLHPFFNFPKGRLLERTLIQWNTHITSLGAHKRIALSFSEFPSVIKHNISVLPPLLRKEILDLHPKKEEYFLVYLLNDGYAEEILKWHEKNRNVKLHCFWDKKEIEEEYKVHENLHFHKLNDTKFLQLMAGCSGFISTAGFESICEAMFLQKPVMMVPTQGHYEQECNALDACEANAGIHHTEFDLTPFINYLPSHTNTNTSYKEWVNKAEKRFLEEMELV